MSVTGRAVSAIVFAYHDVGVRCLRVLLDAGVRVPLVVTHRDDPGENVWFGSVEDVATEQGLPCAAPDDPNATAFVASARELSGPIDFVFSFYYRRMLAAAWLALPTAGAFNLHGSLLPKYRGRSPVNWAVIHGERETGVTLHVMDEKPDRGAIVDQFAVPILGDDTGREVFGKIVVAAEIVLARSLPKLIDGTAQFVPQNSADASYFGGRRPEDGRIPPDAGVRQIHNLVRALAPPYPGAFVMVGGRRILIDRTLHTADRVEAPGQGLRLYSDRAALWLLAANGGALRILAARVEGDAAPIDANGFERRFSSCCIRTDP